MVACVTHIALVVTYGCMCDTRCIGCYIWLHVWHTLYWLLQMVVCIILHTHRMDQSQSNILPFIKNNRKIHHFTPTTPAIKPEWNAYSKDNLTCFHHNTPAVSPSFDTSSGSLYSCLDCLCILCTCVRVVFEFRRSCSTCSCNSCSFLLVFVLVLPSCSLCSCFLIRVILFQFCLHVHVIVLLTRTT